MRVRLDDGSVVTVPDSIKTQADLDDYIEMQREPSIAERTVGNLQLGVHNMAEGLGNLANTLGMGGPGQVLTDVAESFGGMESARRTVAHPATSVPGQIAEGLVRFVPEIPLWALGEGAVMRTATSLPKVGRFAKMLVSPTEKAVKAGLAPAEGIIKSTVKAAGRAGLTGGVIGPMLAPPESTISERLERGAEEAKGFAIGVGILHPMFMGLRKAIGKAIGKRRGITDADVKDAMEDPEIAAEVLKDEKVADIWDEYREMQDAQREDIFQREGGWEGMPGFGTEDLGVRSGENFTKDWKQSSLFPEMSEPSRNVADVVEPEPTPPVPDPRQLEFDFGKPTEGPTLESSQIQPESAKVGLTEPGPSSRIESEYNQPVEQRSEVQSAAVEPPKKVSIKYVTDEQAQMLIQGGFKVKDIRALVKDTIDSVPRRERLIDRRLLDYAYKREDIAKMTKEQKIEALKKEEVDDALTEAIRNIRSTMPRPTQPKYTPEELQRIAMEQEANIRRALQERVSKQTEKLKSLGYTEQDIATMPTERRIELIEKGVQAKAKAAVDKIQSSEKVTEEDLAELQSIADDAELAESANSREEKFDLEAAQREEREIIQSHWREFFLKRSKIAGEKKVSTKPELKLEPESKQKPKPKARRRDREEARRQKQLEELMDAYKGAEGQLAKATEEGNERLIAAMNERMIVLQDAITKLVDKTEAPKSTKPTETKVIRRRTAKTEDLNVPEAQEDWEAKLREEGLGEIDSEIDAEGNPRELDFDNEGGYTLDMLGGQQIYERLRRLILDRSPKSTAEAITMKQRVKDTIGRGLQNGDITADTPIRLTSVLELQNILRNGRLQLGRDYEGYVGISAQMLRPDAPIVAYGPNNRIPVALVFPKGAIEAVGSAPNEVLIDPKTSVRELKFVVGDVNKVLTYDQLLGHRPRSVTLESGGLQTLYETALKWARKDGTHPAERIIKNLQGDPTFSVKDIRPQGDILPWTEYYRIPLRLAQSIGGRAYDVVFALNKADHQRKWDISEDYTLFRSIQDTLTPDLRLKVTRILDGKESASTEVEAKAVAQLRDYFDMMWEARKAARLKEFQSHLTSNEWEALDSIINRGVSEDVALANFKDVDRDVLKKLIDDYNDIGKGKVENYIPKVERGTILLRKEKEADGKPGAVIAVALNTDDAVRKAIDFKSRNADYTGNIYLDTNIRGLETAVGLTKTKYWKVVNQLANAINKELKDINEGIAKSVGRTAARRGVSKVFTIKPTDKFSPFDQPRKDILEGEADIFDILYSYAYSMRTKNALDPVIADARRAINTDYAGKPNIQKFLTNLVEDTKGRYWSEDRQLDALMKMMGYEEASMTATKIAGQAREVEGVLKLGYRPVSALFNRLGGAANTWTKVGTDIYLEARQWIKTPEGKKFLSEMNAQKGISMSHEVTGELKTANEWWHPMTMFERPEIPNRDEGIAANYIYAKKRLGLDDVAAREFAIRENWFQQATYNMANLPRLLRSPGGKLMGQFKTYLVNQLEFMASLRGPEVGRYMIAQIALGGPRGAVALLKSLPVLAAFTPWWDELEEYMNKNYPAAYRGIGGALGVDVTGPATMQMPNRIEDLLGPALSDVISTYSDIVKPYITQERPLPTTLKEGLAIGAEALGNIAPIVRYWPKLVIDKLAHPTQDGFIIKDDRGREMYRLKDSDYWKEVMGAEPLESARVRIEEGILNRRDRMLQKRKAHIIDVIVDAMDIGEEVPDSVWEEAERLNIKSSSIRREAKLRSLPPDVRRVMRTELARREDVRESYPLEGD